MHYTMKTSVTL